MDPQASYDAWNDLRKGKCCGRFEDNDKGYYCKRCDLFFHEKCGNEAPEYINHPSHSLHLLWLQSNAHNSCNLCGRSIEDLFFRCHICDFDVDLQCAKYPPPEVIDISKTHHHKLTLLKKLSEFDCDAKCEKIGYGFHYKCYECDLTFHVNCVWHPPEVTHPLEVNHSYHPRHPLWLQSNAHNSCNLCGRSIVDLFFRCHICDFDVDLQCAKYPPPEVIDISKTHQHKPF